jgi:OFA family oxalate/formate antiporter-like MFS transporter
MLNKEQKTLQIDKPRIFYGYIIAIASFCILLIVYGIRHSYGVFFTPMATEFGWSHATTSLAFSISVFMEGVFNIILGGITDKYGPRVTITISGILIGLGYCLMLLVTSTWQFYLFYAAIIGIGIGGTWIPLLSTTARWFRARRSLMSGIIMSSLGVGVLIFAPIADQLIKALSWRNTFLLVGIITIVIVTVAAQFLKRDPSKMGLSPFGDNNGINKNPQIAVQGLSVREAMRTYQFWFVILTFFCFGFILLSVSIHIVPSAIKAGILSSVAAIILATFGGLQIIGRIGMGFIADKVGNKRIYILAFLVSAADLLFLTFNSATWALFLFVIIFGIFLGGLGSSQPSWIANLFGLKNHGALYGIGGFGFTLGAALGPYISGQVFDITQSYQMAFMICACVSLLGMVLTLLIKPVKSNQIRTVRL